MPYYSKEDNEEIIKVAHYLDQMTGGYCCKRFYDNVFDEQTIVNFCFIKDNDNIVIKRDREKETGAAYICIDCFLGFLNEAQIDPLLGSVLPGTLEETCAFFLNLPH